MENNKGILHQLINGVEEYSDKNIYMKDDLEAYMHHYNTEQYADTIHKTLHMQYVKKLDTVLKTALEFYNIPLEEDYLRQHITRVIPEGDEYEHYIFDAGLETEKRIVSIQKIPTLSFEDYTAKVEAKFY